MAATGKLLDFMTNRLGYSVKRAEGLIGRFEKAGMDTAEKEQEVLTGLSGRFNAAGKGYDYSNESDFMKQAMSFQNIGKRAYKLGKRFNGNLDEAKNFSYTRESERRAIADKKNLEELKRNKKEEVAAKLREKMSNDPDYARKVRERNNLGEAMATSRESGAPTALQQTSLDVTHNVMNGSYDTTTAKSIVRHNHKVANREEIKNKSSYRYRRNGDYYNEVKEQENALKQMEDNMLVLKNPSEITEKDIQARREAVETRVYGGSRREKVENLLKMRQASRDSEYDPEVRKAFKEDYLSGVKQIREGRREINNVERSITEARVENLRNTLWKGTKENPDSTINIVDNTEKAETSTPQGSKTSGAQATPDAQEAAKEAASEDFAGHAFSESAQGKMAKLRGAVGGDSAVEHYMKGADKYKSEMQALKGKEGYDAAKEAYKNYLERGPGMGDYIYGNGLHYKAAGIAIGGGILATTMGDGRRSNAQLYSSPF